MLLVYSSTRWAHIRRMLKRDMSCLKNTDPIKFMGSSAIDDVTVTVTSRPRARARSNGPAIFIHR